VWLSFKLLDQCFSNSFLAYHCPNTKHLHVPLSQYKTCTRIAVTTQNMYTYQYHSTKHVHVPLSQYKAFTRIIVTIQNMYTYHYHNTKHVHVPVSQYKTCTRTTVTIQNMYAYHCHNTKHVRMPLSTANINAYFQDTGGLPGCFAGWQVWSLQTCQPAKHQVCGDIKFRIF
jgi:hypothetical protein